MKIAAVEEILSVGYVTAPSKTISKYCVLYSACASGYLCFHKPCCMHLASHFIGKWSELQLYNAHNIFYVYLSL